MDFILVTSLSPFLVVLAHRSAVKNHIMRKETKKGIKLQGGHRDMILTLELTTSGGISGNKKICYDNNNDNND